MSFSPHKRNQLLKPFSFTIPPRKEKEYQYEDEEQQPRCCDENYILLPIPGILCPLKICFPTGKLPVCTRCKNQYKTRTYCRYQRKHRSPPWCDTYLCLTFDKSCFLEDEGEPMRLKTGDNINFIVQSVEGNDVSHARKTIYKIKENSLSLVSRRKDQHVADENEEDTIGDEDDSSEDRNTEKFLLPLCSQCKKKRYSTTHCRGKPTLHRFLPWNTHYFEVSCSTAEDQNIHKCENKGEKSGETRKSGIFKHMDNESRTLFAQVSVNECKVEWLDACSVEKDTSPKAIRKAITTRQSQGNDKNDTTPFSLVDSNSRLNAITRKKRKEEQQEETKNKVYNHLDLIRQDGHNSSFYHHGYYHGAPSRTTDHYDPCIPQVQVNSDSNRIFLPYPCMNHSCCPYHHHVVHENPTIYDDHDSFDVTVPFSGLYDTRSHDHGQLRFPISNELESQPPFSPISHKNGVEVTTVVHLDPQELVITTKANNKRKREDNHHSTDQEEDWEHLNLWIDNFLKGNID